MSRIPHEEALQLPNKTAPEAPYEGSGYLIVLSVFHNLHCLDFPPQSTGLLPGPKMDGRAQPVRAHGGWRDRCPSFAPSEAKTSVWCTSTTVSMRLGSTRC
ncbi:hypothetical protein DL546_002789 [Coniochaeta pulveracea]|uniref:Uncharacterized protein n=1 Tax=Coniochaeta pulveracea TaxID=177199 RepID=A0A420XZP3_9PEZI|nr:hypothetical protein DL546_002789 [Coniochaeta pulveracea]